MARKAALYTVVFVDDGQIEIATYGDDLEEAKERLATFPDGKAKLFASEPVPFRVRREPMIELVETPAKKRGRRKKTPVEAAGPVVTPPVVARGKSTTPEA